MSRLRRMLAHPHKVEALGARLFSAWRRRMLTRLPPERLPTPFGSPGEAAAHLRSRAQPRFFFDPDRIPLIVADLSNAEQERVLAEAGLFRDHTFAFRSLPAVTFRHMINWQHLADEDPDWNADLHRLDWIVSLLLAGHLQPHDRDWTRSAGAALRLWWENNPPGSRCWADPFEIAQRSNTLAWVVSLAAALPAFDETALHVGLQAWAASARWTAALLEYHVPNNHLLIEALRLAQAGLLLPELARASDWLRTGLGLLEREMTAQVLPDGVHAERSVFYQRMVLEAVIEFLLLAERNDIPLPAVLAERAKNMVEFLIVVRRPDGEFPLLGDGFQADCLLRYNLPAASASILGTENTPEPPDGRTLWLLNGNWPAAHPSRRHLARMWETGGYAVLGRDGTQGQSYLVFDCGTFGMAAAPGHGHADCLSLELSIHGEPYLVDPGSYSWRLDDGWRQAFRSTRAHNTVGIDGHDQTPLAGRYECGRLAQPSLRHVILADSLRLLQATHDGYARLPGSPTHQRTVIELQDDAWLIIDRLLGEGRHQAEVYWHFHPEVSTVLDGQTLVARRADRGGLAMTWCSDHRSTSSLSRGQGTPPMGWVSAQAGRREAADVLTVSGTSEGPTWIVSLLTPFQGHPCGSSLEATTRTDGLVVLCRGNHTSTEVLLAGKSGERRTVNHWTTDAEILVVHETPATRSILLANSAYLNRDGQVYMEDTGTVPSLVMTYSTHRLLMDGPLRSTMRIHLGGARDVVVNGRPMQPVPDRDSLARVETLDHFIPAPTPISRRQFHQFIL